MTCKIATQWWKHLFDFSHTQKSEPFTVLVEHTRCIGPFQFRWYAWPGYGTLQ